MKTLITLLLLLSLATLAQTRIIPFSTNPTVAGGGGGYTTDQLTLAWIHTDHAAGLVDTLYDQIDNYPMSMVVAGERLNNTDSGMVFVNGDENMYHTDYPNLLDSAVTIEFVGKVDTTFTDTDQVLFGQRSAGLILFNIGINTEGYFGASYYNTKWGTNDGRKQNYVGAHGWHHFVATYDGGSTVVMYIDGVVATDLNDNLHQIVSQARIQIGYGEGVNPAPGTIFKYGAFYKKVLTQEEVTNNYNSATIQDLLP